jgi:hypothetical protein
VHPIASHCAPGVAETQFNACDADSRHHPTWHKLSGICNSLCLFVPEVMLPLKRLRNVSETSGAASATRLSRASLSLHSEPRRRRFSEAEGAFTAMQMPDKAAELAGPPRPRSVRAQYDAYSFAWRIEPSGRVARHCDLQIASLWLTVPDHIPAHADLLCCLYPYRSCAENLGNEWPRSDADIGPRLEARSARRLAQVNGPVV